MLLPPRPAEKVLFSKSEWPESRRDFGLAVQGRYSGTLTRLVAGITDHILLTTIFTIFTLLTSIVGEKIYGDKDFWEAEFLEWLIPLAYLLFTLTYYILSWVLVGRTIGMIMLGLLVVSSTGHRISFCQALVRAVSQPFNVVLFGVVLGLIRRDGRQWHDLITGTGFVYSWDARLATLREEDDLLDVSVHFGSNDIMETPHHDHDGWNAEIPEKAK